MIARRILVKANSTVYSYNKIVQLNTNYFTHLNEKSSLQNKGDCFTDDEFRVGINYGVEVKKDIKGF